MDALTVLCMGQARTISETAQAWPPPTDDQDGSLLRGCERLRDSAVIMVDVAASIMERAWTGLFAGRIPDPQNIGEKLDRVLRIVDDAITALEALLRHRQDAGLAIPDLSLLVRGRESLNRLNERFRDGWPYLRPEELAEIEQARHRPSSEYLTLEEFARGLATPDRP